MSDHAHDEHSHAAHDHGHAAHGHDAHDAHDAHGHDAHGHAHDDHGHGDGHEANWGDYNSQPLPPSNLPAVSPLLLVAFGTALTFLLCMIIASSFMLAQSPERHLERGDKAPEAAGEGRE